MAASSGASWAQLRQQARTAESQTEALFHSYSQFSSPTNVSPKATDDEERIEFQIKEQLEKREQLISQLSQLLESESALTSSALKQNNLSRHREVLAEHKRELQRIKAGITDARNRANLLNNVRSDIDAYHRSTNPAQAEADYMLRERGQIDESHRMVDGVLSQAYSINDNFRTQRETLAGMNRRLVGAVSQFPGINQLMSKISSKKRRDAIILAVFLAFCILMLLYFR